jgi:hypothetical protein
MVDPFSAKWKGASMWVPVCALKWMVVRLTVSPRSKDKTFSSSKGVSSGQTAVPFSSRLLISMYFGKVILTFLDHVMLDRSCLETVYGQNSWRQKLFLVDLGTRVIRHLLKRLEHSQVNLKVAIWIKCDHLARIFQREIVEKIPQRHDCSDKDLCYKAAT